MAVFQLIYMGSVVEDEPNALLQILDSAVHTSARQNITGMMLYSDGNLMQVLEGEKHAVMQTFHSIQMDPRQSGIFVLTEHEIKQRQFSCWSLGYGQLAIPELEKSPLAAHVFKVRQEEITRRCEAGDALRVLKSFAEQSMSSV